MTTGAGSSALAAATLEQRAVFDLWQRELLRYVHRLTGDPDLAEDVAQEALVRLWEKQAHEAIANPLGWLFRVATNLVRDRTRREETARRLARPPDAGPPAIPDAELERKETIGQVRAALERLSLRDRELLLMRESGFRYSEIAEVIGVKTESVPTIARRALERFEAAFRVEMESHASE